jgi:hypothetical protein
MTIRSFVSVIVALTGILGLGQSAAFAHGTAPPPQSLFAVLLGGNEVSDTGEANAGDPGGRGSATVIISDTTACFGIVVDGIDGPTAAHIHRAVAGVNGDIVVVLTPPSAGDPGASSGCVPVNDPALLTAIRRDPSAFYVNVHTGEFPAGAIRGQLF